MPPRTPRTFAEIARVGPIAHQGEVIAQTIADRSFTGIVAVCTPEEMPVNETLALREALVAEQLDLDAVVLNARYPDRFDDASTVTLRETLTTTTATAARIALQAALSEQARARIHDLQEARLSAAFPDRLLTLPFVFSPQLGPDQLEELADVLDQELR
jgi:anion-transporting  ArsA/GET3 family ATPase